MKKLFVTGIVAMLAAAPAFSMEGQDSKQKMEDKQKMEESASKDKAHDTVQVGEEEVSAVFERDNISEDNAKKIETALSEKGYFQGEPDGNIDDSTIDSLKKFQESENITAEGDFNQETLEALGVEVDLKQAQEAAE